jgi:hypothetical protein
MYLKRQNTSTALIQFNKKKSSNSQKLSAYESLMLKGNQTEKSNTIMQIQNKNNTQLTQHSFRNDEYTSNIESFNDEEANINEDFGYSKEKIEDDKNSYKDNDEKYEEENYKDSNESDQSDDESVLDILNDDYKQIDFLEDEIKNENEVSSVHDDDDDNNIDLLEEIKNLQLNDFIPTKFSILEESLKLVDEMQSYKYPLDNLNLLHETSTFTKGEFARDTCAFIKRNNISPKAEAELFNLLRKYLVGFDLPIKLTKKKKNYCSVLNDYSEPINTFKRYDICKNGCCIFVGDLIKHVQCPSCKQLRYRKNNTIKKCQGQVAIKQLNYRPIIPLFCFLLAQPGFLAAINYSYKYGDDNTHNLYNYTDVCQGKNYKHNLKQMDANFKRKCDKLKNVINVPILLSEFYDGVQTSKKKVSYIFNLFYCYVN